MAAALDSAAVDSTAVDSAALDSKAAVDWRSVAAEVDSAGFALTPPLLSPEQCAEVIDLFDRDEVFRSRVVMTRHSYGKGTYRYFADPLVPLVADLRTTLYPPLAELANQWAEKLGERTFPADLETLVAECADHGQHRPTPLVLRYDAGGYNCLHQDVYGDLTFPLQVAIMLSTPDEDFTGGESVFVENRPRQQSRAMVARPGRGAGLVFPVRHRPVPGARGYRRVQLRHGVSAVHSGQRYVLGIIFHNAR
ncbi:2OG-Fe(II) oxygenase [Actinokineospora sp. NBRC 105648]|uniref:2OG-Fe(II) oxygenase n=1 Tax=Actinokineospora sp. NBRC 105648 TaxID=3032206 RepID=UPI0024A34E81|nr:2OG-Fe(II) oxygenase [Actinokineospora sp. NBRC 105648]GLZ36508.1 prolyl 4-hydroxylase [Actinokineospora sp. NBRC 105648]